MQENEKIEKYINENDFEEKEEWNWKEKLNAFLSGRYFIAVAVILLTITAFCLGRISGLQEKREPVRIVNSNNSLPNSLGNNPLNPPYIKGETKPTNIVGEVKGATDSSGQVVASKNGTKYHYPWCAGAKQISEKNKITFDSIEKARAAGYTPATNCKGLK